MECHLVAGSKIGFLECPQQSQEQNICHMGAVHLAGSTVWNSLALPGNPWNQNDIWGMGHGHVTGFTIGIFVMYHTHLITPVQMCQVFGHFTASCNC